MTISDRRLSLEEQPKHPSVSHSIDIFFRSLAEDVKERAIAIVLSGAGSDGADGARAIKAQQGLVIVQDPETAKYDSVPLLTPQPRRRAQIMEYTYRGVVRIGLPITPEKGRLEFGVQLFRVLAELDLIIVAAREGACIGNAHGDVLTESVRIGRVETGDLSMNLWSPPVKGPTSDAVTSAPAPVGSVIKTRGA